MLTTFAVLLTQSATAAPAPVQLEELLRGLGDPFGAAETPARSGALRPFVFPLSGVGGADTVRSLELELAAGEPLGPSGARALTELRIAVEPEGGLRAELVERVLRATELQLEFDGQTTVRAPLGDFFGASPGREPTASGAPRGTPLAGGLVCRFPMPFLERAKLRLIAHGTERALFSGSLRSAPLPSGWEPSGHYFHAGWSWCDPCEAQRPRVELRGGGALLGAALALGAASDESWSAARLALTRDGAPPEFEPLPELESASGQSGWRTPLRPRTARWERFAESLELRVEQPAGAVDGERAAALAWYAYAMLPESATAAPDLLVEGLRRGVRRFARPALRIAGALEAEGLAIAERSAGLAAERQELADSDDGRWSGGAQLWVRSTAVGQYVVLELPVATSGAREVVLYPTRSWDYGTIRCTLDGRPAGEPIPTFNAEAETRIGAPRATSLGVHELHAPRALLRVEVSGSHPRSRPPHHYFGLDCVVLKEPSR